jgi:hypothetical protein
MEYDLHDRQGASGHCRGVAGPLLVEVWLAMCHCAGSSAGEAHSLPLPGRNPPTGSVMWGICCGARGGTRINGRFSCIRGRKDYRAPLNRGKVHQVIDDPY